MVASFWWPFFSEKFYTKITLGCYYYMEMDLAMPYGIEYVQVLGRLEHSNEVFKASRAL